MVTVRNEIEHVIAYVQIQNMRFENGIELVIDIPDHLYGFSILKTILQPLAENAILHGILEKESERGRIVISGKLSGGDLLLQIKDDGAGMSEEILQEAPGGVHSSEAHSYGSEYGLSYISSPGEGTTFEIRLPAVPMISRD